MSPAPTIDRLRQALAPVEVLRGEHSLLEKWMRESFAAIDSLHDELTEWQRDLTRQQAMLDQREAAVADASEEHMAAAVAAVEKQLRQTQEESRQLTQENAEQLRTIAIIEKQLLAAKAEVRLTAQRADELSVALHSERERAAEEHRQWTEELREMRKMLAMAMHARLAIGPTSEGAEDSCGSSDDSGESDDRAARATDLQRHANTLNAAQQRPI